MPEKVRLVNDPVLRKKCDVITSPMYMAVVEDLLDMMYETMTAELGIGLAANQIGHSVMVFILKQGETSYQEFINPEIVAQDELVDFEGEGCLSIPGVTTKTKRYRKVTLKWIDRNSATHQEDFTDMRAFAIQHEMDHLNGILYIDQFGPTKRELLLGKHRKFLREIGRK